MTNYILAAVVVWFAFAAPVMFIRLKDKKGPWVLSLDGLKPGHPDEQGAA